MIKTNEQDLLQFVKSNEKEIRNKLESLLSRMGVKDPFFSLEDLMQETLITAFRNSHKIKFDEHSRLIGLFYTFARRHIVEYIRYRTKAIRSPKGKARIVQLNEKLSIPFEDTSISHIVETEAILLTLSKLESRDQDNALRAN